MLYAVLISILFFSPVLSNYKITLMLKARAVLHAFPSFRSSGAPYMGWSWVGVAGGGGRWGGVGWVGGGGGRWGGVGGRWGEVGGIIFSKRPWSGDAVLVTRYLTPLISACLHAVKQGYDKQKHIYNESATLSDSCNVDFGTTDRWILPKMVPMTGISSSVIRARLR